MAKKKETKQDVSDKETKRVLHNLNELSNAIVEEPSSVGRSTYDKTKAILQKIATKTLKGKQAYTAEFAEAAKNLGNLAESYAADGQSKVSTRFMVLRNKCLNINKKMANGSLTDVNSIKTEADSILRELSAISPQNAEHLHEKAGIRDQSKAFEGFNKKKVKLEIDPEKTFSLQRAPLLLLFKNKVQPSQKAVLKGFGAHFYQGTNGVSIPEVPILVLNKGLVEAKDYERTIKSIFKALHRPDLVAFLDFNVSKGNAIAFPVFEPKVAEVMGIILFDSTQSKQLWVD